MKFAGLVGKVLLPAVLSPIIAGLIALIATYLAYRITARAAKATVTKGFKLGQIVSGSMVALPHGTNDAQKTMGVITLTLITAGLLPANAGPPFWVILSSGLAIALGTYMGGWRIIRPSACGSATIETPQGFASGISTATVILTSSHLGFPLSTTQVATGSIFGAGAARGAASVHWGIGGQVAFAWLLTLPAAAAFGAVAAWMADTGPLGTIIVALALVASRAASTPRRVVAGSPPTTSTTYLRHRRRLTSRPEREDSRDYQLGSTRGRRGRLARRRRAARGPGVVGPGRALRPRARPPGEPAGDAIVIARAGSGLSRAAGTVLARSAFSARPRSSSTGSTFSLSDRNAKPGNGTTG